MVFVDAAVGQHHDFLRHLKTTTNPTTPTDENACKNPVACASCQPKCASRSRWNATVDLVTVEFNKTTCKPDDTLSWICCPTCLNVRSCSDTSTIHVGSPACDAVNRSATYEIPNSLPSSSNITVQGHDGKFNGIYNFSISSRCPGATNNQGGSCPISDCEWNVSLSDCCYIPKICNVTNATLNCTEDVPPATTIVSNVFAIPPGSVLCDGLTLSDTNTTAGSICTDGGKIFVRTYALLLDNVPVAGASCSQTFTIPRDTMPPVPNDDCAAGTGNCTFTDDCSTPTVNYTCSVNDTNVLIRTWNGTDSCGNTNLVNQTVPITCSNLPDQNIPGCNISVIPIATTNVSDVFALAAPLCSGFSLASVDSVPGSLCPDGITVHRNYTLYLDGNPVPGANCLQTFLVQDTSPPTLEKNCSEGYENCTFTDTCSHNLTVTSTCSVDNSVLIRTWNATDPCNNTNLVNQTIPAPCKLEAVELQGACNDSVVPKATTNITEVFEIPPGVCADLSMSSDNKTIGTICDVGGIQYNRTYTLTLNSAVVATCLQIFTIPQDTIAPIPDATCHYNSTLFYCDGTIPSETVESCTFTDNCGTPSVELSCSLSGNVFTRSWTAKDTCKNATQVNHLFNFTNNCSSL